MNTIEFIETEVVPYYPIPFESMYIDLVNSITAEIYQLRIFLRLESLSVNELQDLYKKASQYGSKFTEIEFEEFCTTFHTFFPESTVEFIEEFFDYIPQVQGKYETLFHRDDDFEEMFTSFQIK